MQIGGGDIPVVGPRLEQAISSLIMRARLYERIVHDPGPWLAVLYGPAFIRVPLERYLRPDRVVLIGYLREPGARIIAAEIWCGDDMMASWPVDPPADTPVRVSLMFGIEDAEVAA
jgi:hypothetical protein